MERRNLKVILTALLLFCSIITFSQGPLLSDKELGEVAIFESLDDALDDPKEVIVLDLFASDLGTLPDLSKFPNLQVLYLYDNALSGIKGIGKLANLQKLFLDDNN